MFVPAVRRNSPGTFLLYRSTKRSVPAFIFRIRYVVMYCFLSYRAEMHHIQNGVDLRIAQPAGAHDRERQKRMFQIDVSIRFRAAGSSSSTACSERSKNRPMISLSSIRVTALPPHPISQERRGNLADHRKKLISPVMCSPAPPGKPRSSDAARHFSCPPALRYLQ